jgi:hypothetical protein
MPRLTVDPNLAEAPDFNAGFYTAIRDALALAQNITPAAATESLQASWTAENDAKKALWAQQLQEDQELEEVANQATQAEIEREKEETERANREEQKEREKKKPKLNPFTPNKPVASYITHRPSRFAMQKLQDREYIELSYFTPEGREEAANHDHTVAEEAFALSKVNDYVGLRPIAAFKASKSVIPDNKLTWIQMTRAKTNLLNCMEETGWPSDYSNALATFFLSIENHPRLQRAGGERVMLAYQAQVRRDWHRALKDPTGNHAFDISIINEDLLNAMSTKITEDIHQQLTARSVSLVNIK